MSYSSHCTWCCALIASHSVTAVSTLSVVETLTFNIFAPLLFLYFLHYGATKSLQAIISRNERKFDSTLRAQKTILRNFCCAWDKRKILPSISLVFNSQFDLVFNKQIFHLEKYSYTLDQTFSIRKFSWKSPQIQSSSTKNDTRNRSRNYCQSSI